MLHIVFQEENVNTLSKSFELDESLKGDIFHIKDDYAVGPLLNINSKDGINTRETWWREVLEGGGYEGLAGNGEINDPVTVEDLRERLESDKENNLWIWIAPNKHDVCGYYWIISQLNNLEGRVQVLWLNNLPFINDKGHIFYPKNLFEIPSREFVKAQKLARPVSAAEFEIDPDEWGKICNENKMVRTLEGHKKLQQHDADFYDAMLLNFITPDWQKASKVIHQFLNRSQETTGDAYLLWRLKKLITANIIDAQGEVKSMKDFEVKLKINEN